MPAAVDCLHGTKKRQPVQSAPKKPHLQMVDRQIGISLFLNCLCIGEV